MFYINARGVYASTLEIMRPYAGFIRIRFIGYDLSPGGHPCKCYLYFLTSLFS